MKQNLLLLAVALTAAFASMSARAQDEVSFEFFYDNLSPYGDWVEVGDYGTCWRPRDVDADWAPYTDGYWSYTDAGWTWVSYEDFGDICYHYGRWVRTDDIGWCWVPDYEWGPAWVSWRKSDDYIGWAPLPPEARWRASVGFSVWVDDYYDIGPTYYNYCPVVEFGAPVIRAVCVPRHRAVSLFGLTVNITNISYNSYNRNVFCGGPDYYHINRVGRRPIPALKLVQNTTIVNNNVTIINNRRVVRGPRNRVAGNTLQVFAPKVVNKANANLIKPQIAQVIARPKIDKGWASVRERDPGEFRKLRDKVKSETKGLTPETAPAKPVAVADLKPLPPKADTAAPSPVQVPSRPSRPGRERPTTSRPGADDAQPGIKAPPAPPPTSIAQPSVPPSTRPTAPGDRPKAPEAPGAQPGGKPEKITADRPDRPGRPSREPKAPMPSTPAGETPGRTAGDKPRPTEANRPVAEPGVTQPPMPKRPTATTENPLHNPFRQSGRPTGPQSGSPALQPDRKDAADRVSRQQQEAVAAQKRMAEQRTERLRRGQTEARQATPESLRPPQPGSDLSEQRQRQAAEAAQRAAAQRQAAATAQRQAESAQRQAAMQRQAEAQQRAAQAQRQESLQRQMRSQQSQQPQIQPRPQIVRPQSQPRPQSVRPPLQPRPQSQPRPQVQARPQVQPMPRAQPQARPQMPPSSRGGLTPDQLEALKKRR